MKRLSTRLGSVLVIVTMVTAAAVGAQELEDEATALIDEVVVTGRPGGSEQRKIDASSAITNISEDAIIKFAPKSTADLFKSIPGVWSESSGGVSGANIMVRGFPGTGDAPFVTLQLQGVPIYTPPSLSFLENSTLFRVDDTIERVEGLRGGPNPVFSNGQPGLTTNFLLKEGGDETEGSIRYTTSDYGLQQVDAIMSGKLTDDLYYMVGGYVRSSEGVRKAGFNAQKGNQFTVNLTKYFEYGDLDGKVNFYARRTDDAGTWYLPVPLNVPGIDASYTQVSSANRNTVVEGPFGEDLVVDYADGRGWEGTITGGSIDMDVNENWTFVDRFSFLKGDADTLGLVPRGGPRTLGDLGLTSADTVITGRTLGPSDFIQHYGFWVVRKDVDSFTNDLTITRSFDRGSVSAGFYSSRYGADDLWNLNNNARYLELGGAREQVDIDCTVLADPPRACLGGFRVNARGDARMNAFYVASEINLTDVFRIDLGVRQVSHEITYVAETGGDPVLGLTGTSNINTEYDESDTSWTVGANWSITDNLALFGRVNQGSRLPYFDNIRGGQNRLAGGDDLLLPVDQFELGLKYVSDSISAYLTAFYIETEDTRSLTPVVGGPTAVFKNEARGLEIDATWVLGDSFSLLVNGTLLDAEITDDPDPALIGNQAARQPKWQVRLSPTFEFKLGEVPITLYGTLTAVGDRQSNVQNTQPLPGYEKFDVGVLIDATDRINIRVFGDNVTDEQGLTEGDPRSFDINTNGRYILPRSWRVSVGYNF